MGIIRAAEMLRVITRRDENGELIPFAVTFVTCDLKRGTGGEKITMDRAVFAGGPGKSPAGRNPNHMENYTRNIRHQDSDRIIKIHPLLVTRFNGNQVCQ